jgi:DNA-binding NtrC family response regulator
MPLKDFIRALLLHTQDTPAAALLVALEKQMIGAVRVFTCNQAAGRLAGPDPPHLVFTDTELLDGTWSDVMDLSDKASQPINVIVISPTADIPLYIDVMERRAFDFITQSFTLQELTHILRCAVDNVVSRRKEAGSFPTTRLGCAVRPLKGRKEDLIRI